MSIKLSYFLADFFVSRGWISEDGKITYVVGMDVIFSTVAHWMVILLFGIGRDRLVEAVIYLLFFMTVRRYCGGYHASTRVGCFVIFICLYLLADETSMVVSGIESRIRLVGYGVCSFVIAEIVFWLYVPIKNERKRYTEEWLVRARRRSFAYLHVWYILAMVMSFIKPDLTGEIFSGSNMVVLLILIKKSGKR